MIRFTRDIFYFLSKIKKKSDGIPPLCNDKLNWAAKNGAKNPNDYPGMRRICGMNLPEATREDFQRYFRCAGIESSSCVDLGLQYPKTCSSPPCNKCLSGSLF